MTNPGDYPVEISSAESGRPLHRGVKILTIEADGQPFTYRQPGWWASLGDPADTEGQLTDEDNVIRAAARREARAKAKGARLTPLVIRAIREACELSQQDAARVFGGGPKAFEKYEAGEIAPSSAMTRLLLFTARPAVERLRDAARDHLRTRIALPLEAARDWARTNSLKCTCVNCRAAGVFLLDPDQQKWRLKAAQDKRTHVAQSIWSAAATSTSRQRSAAVRTRWSPSRTRPVTNGGQSGAGRICNMWRH